MNIIEGYVQALNYRDLDKATELFSEEGKIKTPDHATPTGKNEIKKYFEQLDPDGTFTVENIVVKENEASALYTYIDGSTKKGEWKFFLRNGKIFELTITEVKSEM